MNRDTAVANVRTPSSSDVTFHERELTSPFEHTGARKSRELCGLVVFLVVIASASILITLRHSSKDKAVAVSSRVLEKQFGHLQEHQNNLELQLRQVVRSKEKQREFYEKKLESIARDHEAQISEYKRRMASMKKIVLEWSSALTQDKNIARSVEKMSLRQYDQEISYAHKYFQLIAW